MSDTAAMATTKEHLNYEGRVRAEKRKDELTDAYSAYLAEHPEIAPLMHDVMQHVLVNKPEHPLEVIRAFVQSRTAPQPGDGSA